jgi:hypothetical protein
MKKNIGYVDGIIRLIVAALIVLFYGIGMINGTSALLLMFIAVIFVLTSLVRVCPLYLSFGISTRKKH